MNEFDRGENIWNIEEKMDAINRKENGCNNRGENEWNIE